MAIDLKKSLDAYQARRGEFRLLEVPPTQYLMLDGSGDPNVSQAYADAVGALYSVAYALKFTSKRQLGIDTVVMPLEGLWHAEDMESFTTHRDKSTWQWTMMIMMPDHVTAELFAVTVDEVAAKLSKKKETSSALGLVRFDSLHEGLSVQTLHVGSYDEEAPVLEEMHHRFIPEHDLKMTGRHHEIYLGDPRKSAPEKLRTILRQPVAAIN
jgi:hypothetical protein